MPYQNEFAQHKVLKHFVESGPVKEMLESCRIPPQDAEGNPPYQFLARNKWRPKYVVAIDGSHYESPYKLGFPGAEISFVSVATVLIDTEKLLSEAAKPSIDPAEFARVQSAYTLPAVFPSTNMVRPNCADSRASFRQTWYELLRDTRPSENSESLLETYEALLQLKSHETDYKCPLMDLCEAAENPTPVSSAGTCACGKYPAYSSDALRIHERFSDMSSNGESFGEVMRVLENLFLVAYVRGMERICHRSGSWNMFKDTAIVMDGSLAVFGHPAWLSQAIKRELSRINKKVREMTGDDMLVFGIEKSGRFFDHWCRLDIATRRIDTLENTDEDSFEHVQRGRIPLQAVLLPDDSYIKRYIVPSESTKVHGKDTYFGRPFLYKTSTGAMIVGISAILSEKHDDRHNADADRFPRLADVLDLLDVLVSHRYPNAVIPLIAAHSEAAIPLQMGEKVLDRLSSEHVGRNSQ
jgi:hypothetical protein